MVRRFILFILLGLLMLVFRQGLYISFLCLVSITLCRPGLVTEQTARSSWRFQRCIVDSSLGKSVFHSTDNKLDKKVDHILDGPASTG